MNNGKSIKQKIIEEMTVDYSDVLEKCFETAKQLIRITRDGKVDILVKDKRSGTDQIKLYLIGKMYAKKAGLAATDDVGNEELLHELGVPEGSLYPWLKELKDGRIIKGKKRGKKIYHAINANYVEKTLKEIMEKVEKEV